MPIQGCKSEIVAVMKDTMTGGCQCGAVRYEILEAPTSCGFCHCRDCQRSTGSGHAPFMLLNRDSLRVDGKTNCYQSENNNGGVTIRHFCAVCGSRLFAEIGESPMIYSLYAGTLDDPNRFIPTIAIYVSRRTDWDQAFENLKEYSESAP